MKTFKISLFKGCITTPIAVDIVTISSKEELKTAKNQFKSKYKTWIKNPKNWVGVKRVK